MRLVLILALLATEPPREQRWAKPDARDRRLSRIIAAPVADLACVNVVPACTSGRTNYLLWANDPSNAAWTKDSSVVAAPTITANYALGPDCTTMATRMQLPATTGTQYSRIFQSAQAAWTGAGLSMCFYVKGNGTSGTIDGCTFDSTATCGNATYVSTGWTLFKRENFTMSVNRFVEIGNMTAFNGGTARGSADVLVADIQATIGTTCAGFIPTTTAAATCP